MKIRSILCIAALPIITTGCASIFNTANESSFSCPGMPQGVTCKTPMAVYKSTNQMPAPIESDLPMGVTMDSVAKNSLASESNPTAFFGKPASAQAVPAVLQYSPTKTAAMARPVREPAQVMRIWIAPWIDKNDDLHYPSYVFTEVQPRRWSLGKPEFGGKGATIPYKALAAVAPVQPAENSADAKAPGGEARQSGSASAVPPMSITGIPSPSDIKLD